MATDSNGTSDRCLYIQALRALTRTVIGGISELGVSRAVSDDGARSGELGGGDLIQGSRGVSIHGESRVTPKKMGVQ